MANGSVATAHPLFVYTRTAPGSDRKVVPRDSARNMGLGPMYAILIVYINSSK